MEHRSVLSRLLWLISTCLLAVKGSSFEFRDFLAKNRLSDGELETRIRFRGVTAKETTVSGGNNTGITFRQLTTGRHFIQLIYDPSLTLRDCEYMDNDPKQVHKFLTTFTNDIQRLGNNVSVVALGTEGGMELPPDVQRWMRYGKLRNRCRKVQVKLRKEAERREKVLEDDSDEDNRLQNEQQKARHPRSITYVTKTTKRILGGLRESLGSRAEQFFIFPGMQWCGMSDRARKYTDVGAYMETDRCCRKHDLCKLAIPGNHRKYYLYNSSLFTRTHCHCDRSFRTCLKMVDTSDSNLIGKIFFNVVQTKCFVMKPKKLCVRRSWWGKKCLKWKATKKAILKDNMPY